MDRPLRNNTLPQTTSGQPTGVGQPSEQDQYATNYLVAAMVRTGAATGSHAVEVGAVPPTTEAGLWQRAFLGVRKP